MRKLLSIFAVCITSILITEISVLGFREMKFSAVSNSLEGLFIRQENSENPYLLSLALIQLQKLELISCPRLWRNGNQELPYFEDTHSSDCKSRVARIFKGQRRILLPAANGEIWTLDFIAKFSQFESILIWLFRLLGLLIGLSIWAFFRWLQRLRESENERRSAILKAANVVYRQIAHDLKSPVSALNLLTQNPVTSSQEQSQLLRSIAKRLTGILNDSELKTEPSKTSMSTLNQAMTELEVEFASVAKSNSINLKFPRTNFSHSQMSLGIPVSTLNWTRMISNVLTNSIDASPRNITIKMEIHRDSLVTSIEDDGKGIPKEILSKIGEEGFSYGKQKGQGIGLFSTKNLLIQSGGSFDVFSKEGVGTIVKLVLPLT